MVIAGADVDLWLFPGADHTILEHRVNFICIGVLRWAAEHEDCDGADVLNFIGGVSLWSVNVIA